MKRALLLTALLAAAPAVLAQDNDREAYEIPPPRPSMPDHYQLSIEVEDLDAVYKDLDAAAKAAGCDFRSDTYDGGASGGPFERRKVSTCSVPVETAEKTAKEFAKFGKLMDFSAMQGYRDNRVESIKKEFAPLLKEYEKHKKDLKKIPITACLLENKVSLYNRYVRASEVNGGRTTIRLTMTQPKKGPRTGQQGY